jgi:hypothetical protein
MPIKHYSKGTKPKRSLSLIKDKELEALRGEAINLPSYRKNTEYTDGETSQETPTNAIR